MSKKNKKFQVAKTTSLPQASHDLVGEYRIIRSDMIRVVVFNIIMLAAVLVVYYTNLQHQYLEHLTSRFLHF